MDDDDSSETRKLRQPPLVDIFQSKAFGFCRQAGWRFIVNYKPIILDGRSAAYQMESLFPGRLSGKRWYSWGLSIKRMKWFAEDPLENVLSGKGCYAEGWRYLFRDNLGRATDGLNSSWERLLKLHKWFKKLDFFYCQSWLQSDNHKKIKMIERNVSIKIHGNSYESTFKICGKLKTIHVWCCVTFKFVSAIILRIYGRNNLLRTMSLKPEIHLWESLKRNIVTRGYKCKH